MPALRIDLRQHNSAGTETPDTLTDSAADARL
jgi:hypothetical protein